jgi:hypothetical protein
MGNRTGVRVTCLTCLRWPIRFLEIDFVYHPCQICRTEKECQRDEANFHRRPVSPDGAGCATVGMYSRGG